MMRAGLRKDDRDTCPLYEDHMQLKAHSEENRQMIHSNHLQSMTMIQTAQLSHEGLSKSVTQIHDDVRLIAEKIQRAHGMFSAWDMMPKIARISIKILMVAGGASIALKGIFDFLRLFMG